MSGGGGGTPWGNPPEGGCRPVYKEIALLSPVPDIVAKLAPGAELEFEVHEINGKKSLRVRYNGELAGAITKHAAEIINCMEQRYQYKGVVTLVDGGRCMLEARMIS